MEQDFWQDRWDTDRTGFHQDGFNAHLLAHWPTLGVQSGRVLVPLCGKTRDMLWLRDAGHHVVGVEWSQTAVEAFFAENELAVRRTVVGNHARYESDGIEIWCGDFMTLTPELVGEVNAVFDRASLVALPPRMRAAYADALSRLAGPGAPCLTVLLEYPDGSHDGPPFSVPESVVVALYDGRFDVKPLDRQADSMGEDKPVTTTLYVLTRRA
ncbi:MAG: thiopurine S-methyltransferase [Flavobacteriales bacterium]|jgi:thiopurine S-methyltransferase